MKQQTVFRFSVPAFLSLLLAGSFAVSRLRICRLSFLSFASKTNRRRAIGNRLRRGSDSLGDRFLLGLADLLNSPNMKFMQRSALALALLGASAGAIKVDFTDDGTLGLMMFNRVLS